MPNKKRFNLDLLKNFWSIAKLYWFSEQKWRARGLLLLVIVLLATFTVFNLLLTNQRAEFISALSAQDSDRFWQSIIQFFGTVVVAVPFVSSYSFVRQKLSIFWRRWMTHSFMKSYLGDRSFYKISYHPEIDNPDQRIAQDIKSFTDQSLSFLVIILNATFQLFGFSALLWSISKPLVFFVVIYAIAGTVITTGVFGKVLIGINFEQLKREANFRFGLIRIRENAESIAFYGGEKQELQQANHLFSDVFDNFNRLIQWQLYLDIFRNSYEFITFALPSIIIGRRVLSGELEIGVITQAGTAFVIILSSLTLIVTQLDRLTEFAAGINRLSTFSAIIESPPEVPEGESTIDTFAIESSPGVPEGESTIDTFAGELETGRITKAGTAFAVILSSLTLIVNQLGRLREFAAGINRLSTSSVAIESSSEVSEGESTIDTFTIESSLEVPESESTIDTFAIESSTEVPEGESTIDTVAKSGLALEHLTLKTPNYQRTLVRDISLEIPSGNGLLIMGASGSGKSSILRAIAGLWNSGTGAIYRPKLNEILFLPQKPYMVLGSLRQQLLYPQTNLDISDVEIQQVLEKVNLPELAERFGGLDAVENWSQVLSVGEQQRVAFARLFLTKPNYVILDEATSALDVPSEELLYQQLQETSTTFISVGHRPTLKNYHQQLLEITADESWQLKPITT